MSITEFAILEVVWLYQRETVVIWFGNKMFTKTIAIAIKNILLKSIILSTEIRLSKVMRKVHFYCRTGTFNGD